MIRVGFLVDYPHYIGGINYLYNLMYAAKKADIKNEIEFVIFFGKNIEIKQIERFKEFATIVYTSYCDRKSIKWLFYKVLFKFFNITYPLSNFLKKNKVDILSHSSFYGKNLPFKTIEWLPDFQFTHLPYMFTKFEIMRRNKLYIDTIKYADSLVVSSNDAANDFYKFSNFFHEKLNVLQFVTQPDINIYQLNYNQQLTNKYKLKKKFFYLPNQLWKHKNHLVVVEALKILKDQGIEIQVICSGGLDDFRNPNYKVEIFNLVKNYNLEDNMIFLGLIPYLDVQYLIRHSIAVINSSLFEGWSSTVEECKSIGKNMLLSSINVHIEQNPQETLYFEANDKNDLAFKIKHIFYKYDGEPNILLENLAKSSLENRTKLYGEEYLKIIRDTFDH